MSHLEKVLSQVLTGKSDTNIVFNDIRNLMKHLGFEERIKGSHHIFRKANIEEKIVIQKDGNKAKPYQVKQVRNLILKYKLGENINE
jgi:predicted RNA binding protein YcfA (HicA-like mRNA interferase family)